MTDPKITHEEIAFPTSRFQVARITAELPDGQEVEKYVIRHPGAVVLVPILADGRIVMIRNFRYSIEQTLLELPAGTVDAPEEPATTAARELAEETGYVAGKWDFIQSFFAAPGNGDEQMHLFVARDLTESTPNRELGEQIENQPLDWAEITKRIEAGEIVDAKTLVGLLLVHQRGLLA